MHEFNNKSTNAPSFINFIASKANKESVKTLPFIECNDEIGKISEGHYWFDGTKIKKYVMSMYIHLMARTQIIEAAVNDLTLCKTQNRDEITISFMASTHSYFEPNTKGSLQEDEGFMSRKRTNEDAL